MNKQPEQVTSANEEQTKVAGSAGDPSVAQTPMLARPATWDRVTVGYDAELRPMFETFSAKALQMARVKPGMRIVDIAAGPGTLTALAAEMGAAVSALDFSPSMIARLAERIDQAGWPEVTAEVGDGMALPFADASFDSAFSMFGLMFFTDRVRGLAEMHRVLKPGGTAVISSWVPMTKVPLFAAMMGALSEFLPDMMPSKPLPPVLNDEASCRAEFGAAGFVNVNVIEHETTFEAADAQLFVESTLRTNAIVAHLAVAAGDRWPDAERALTKRLHEQFGNGPHRMTMIALITSGQVADQ